MNIMIIPVLDIKNGLAVSGKSGMRETYKPLKTVFSNSSDPFKIAEALKHGGYKELYLADLDAITKNGSNLELISKINSIIPVMLDAGIGNSEDFRKVYKRAQKIIIATETLESLEELELIFSQFSNYTLVLSVDIMNGEVLSKNMNLNFPDVIELVEKIKPSEVIVLDITGVGTKSGFNRKFIEGFSGLDIQLTVGGGVTRENIEELTEMGVQNFLVGTAIHSGKF